MVRFYAAVIRHFSRMCKLVTKVGCSVVLSLFTRISSQVRKRREGRYHRIVEAGAIVEGKMTEYAYSKWCEQISSNSPAYVSPPSTISTPVVTEVRKLIFPDSRECVNIVNSPERASLCPRTSNRIGNSKDTEGGLLKHSGLIHSQITSNHSTFAYPPKLALKLKLPQNENCLAPGTGVHYQSSRSINSKGYGKVCTVEALSLLADVSCNVKRKHQRSSNSTFKLSERFNQKPWELLREKNLPSAEKNGNHHHCKESYTDKRSKKVSLLENENSYKVVRKLRTPRKTSQTMVHCATKMQKNTSPLICDENSSRIGANSSLIDANHSREHINTSSTSLDSSALSEENLIGDYDGKSTTNNTTQVTQAVIKATTLERVSTALYQLCSPRKKPFRGFKRTERFTHQILRFIGEMTVPEKLIRQALGNNPDTSKALRLLLTERKVTRLGTGGRSQAFKYVATEKGLHQLRELEQTGTEVVELTPEYASVSYRISLEGATIVSDASKTEAHCFSIQHPRIPNAPAAGKNESRPSSVTPPLTPTVKPHRSFKWPVQRMKCAISSQSFDLQS